MRSPILALATAGATACALAVAATVSAGADQARACAQSQSPAAAADPVEQEQTLLRDLVGQGWKPTAAGKSLLAGQMPATGTRTANTANGGLQLAIAPAPSSRRLQATKRAASATVWLYCGVGQQGNVNFYEAPGNYAWVTWTLHNFTTGDVKNVRSANTWWCPAGTGGCAEYFYLRPATPWFVWSATEHVVVSPINEYCS